MNNIHHTAIIGDNVRLGSNNLIGPYAVIIGNVIIGDNNWIGPHTTVGSPAEIRNAELPREWETGDHRGTVTIGSHNVIRDACVIHAGFYTGTRIADHCYIMNQVYIAHDCSIESQATLSSNVALGGHVVIQNGANLGMGTLVHQKRIVGCSSILGMGTTVTRDVMPFSKAYGNPCRTHGANVIGMQRSGFSEEEIKQVSEYLVNRDSTYMSKRLSSTFDNFYRMSESADDSE